MNKKSTSAHVSFQALSIGAEAAVVKARAMFPRGLVQPAGSFRFSVDALLVATFVRPGRRDRLLLDLGTGCGVIALAVLLRHPELTAVGLDIQPELLEAAEANAARLGLSRRFSCLAEDAGAEVPALAPGGFDLVVCNPPYRKRGQGRLPRSASRATALFEGPAGVEPFCRAAACALRPGGRLVMVYPAARQEELWLNLEKHGLSPARILPVATRQGEEPERILLEAGLGEVDEPLFLPPLALHEGSGKETRFSRAALELCPELNCNPGFS